MGSKAFAIYAFCSRSSQLFMSVCNSSDGGHIEKEDRFFAKLNSLYRFRNYFPYYKHLREWCEELERKASLTEQEKQEYEKVKKILSKFIKRFNAIARRNNDEHKKEILEHAGLRFDKKLGIVGVENEDKSLL